MPTQKNNQDTLINPKNQLKAGKFEQSNNQMFYNGQTLTRQTLTLENGDVIDDWVNERGNLINVPEEITIEWDKQREAESN